jgi:hypothetical protein
MLTLIVVGSIVVLAGSGLVVWMRASPGRALPAVTPEVTVFSLRKGDVVQYMGTDYTVDSTIRYEQDGLGWQEHLLGGGDRDRWLIVEEDDRVTIALVEVIDDPGGLPTSAIESRPQVTFRGEPYRLQESGHARATRVLPGSGTEQTVRCDYIDYERADGQVLSVEFWPPNDREISHGRKISGAALTILPGS